MFPDLRPGVRGDAELKQVARTEAETVAVDAYNTEARYERAGRRHGG